MHQFYTIHRVLEGTWEFAKPVNMHFVDMEKAFDCVLKGILWGLLHEYRVKALRAVLSLSCIKRAGAWLALPAVSQTCFKCMLDFDRAALYHWF